MRQLIRHKAFIKDMRNVRLTDTQATKLFLYVAKLLEDQPLPPESRDHTLQGEWADFREFHLGGGETVTIKPDQTYLTLSILDRL